MEVESERSLDGSLQAKGARSFLGSNTGGFLTFFLLLVVLFKVYNKAKGKSSKKTGSGKDNEYLGIYDLPKVRNSLPLKLIGCLPQFLPLSRLLKRVEEMSNEYGDLFYAQGLSQDFVIFNSGPTLQTLLKSADFGHLKKLPLLYQPFAPFVTNGVLVSNGVFWQRQRKLLLKSQSYQNLKAYMGLLNRHSKHFVDTLEKLFEDGKLHAINEQINISFLQVICEMVTGKRMDGSKELKEYHHNFKIWKDTVVLRVFNPLLLLKPIWFFHPRSRMHNKAEAELMEFTKKRLEQHKEKRAAAANQDNCFFCKGMNPDKPAFRSILDEMLDAGVDERQIIDEVNVMMFGGHETGASTLHCLLFALAANPKIQKQARKEVDQMFRDRISCKNGQVTYDGVQSTLKYVERCILETLRLFPPIFIKGRKLEKSLKVEYKDKIVRLPAGTNIIISPFMLHRRTDIFPEPHKFDPDRFLPEESIHRHVYDYIPFSAGPRNCLGLKFAMVELKTMAAYILRHFEMTTTDKMEEVVLMPYTTLTPSKDFTFQFKKRSVK